MTTTTKSLLAFAVVAGIFGVCAFFNVTPFRTILQTVVGTSTQGSTFGTAKFAAVAVNLAAPGANATSSSILNTDANDRYITSVEAGCESVGTSFAAYTGAGIASNGLTLSVATSATAAPATNGNLNLVGGGTIVIATSTTVFTTASTTAANSTSKIYTIWPTGTYLTFTTNATNTAVCTFGSKYISS